MGTKMPLDHRARKRFEGFTQALARAGIEMSDREFYAGGSALVKGREMTAAMMDRTPDLDFLYYSNDMIGAGGLLWLLEQGYDIPNRIGLAGFNGVELLQGLPRRLATMDACRAEIGRRAAEIIVARTRGEAADSAVVLKPQINYGDTLRQP
jgi:LacI family gluconate utilization system Gnt-I transcriptional repressor